MKKYILLFFLILPVFLLVGIVYAGHDNGCGATNSCSTSQYCDGTGLFSDNADGTHSFIENCADRGSGWSCANGGCVQSGGGNTCDNGKRVGEQWPECRGCDEGLVTCNGGNNYGWQSVRNPSPNCGASCGGGSSPTPTPPPSGKPGTLACKATLTPTELGINNCSVCDRLHEYKLVAPSGGATTCSQNNTCVNNAGCPENRDQPNLIVPTGSNWCYGFADGARCLQLRYKGTGAEASCGPGDTPRGSQCTGGSCSSVVTGKTQLSPTCANCIDTNDPRLANAIKGLNTNLFTGCTNQQLLSYWCDGGISAQATADCSARKTGICATSCGSSSNSSPSPGAGTRPDLCQSTSANKSTLNPGDSITITSTANTAVKKFMFAFFNNDNTDPVTGPKLISFGGLSYTPIVELPTAQTQTSKTFNFSDLSQPDGNWGGRIPQNIQVNGYFFDNQGNQSLPDSACVANFTLATAPAPTPTPTPTPTPPPPSVFTTQFRVAENPTDLATAEWRPYDSEPIRIDNFEFKDKTPGVKFVWVEFKDSTGKTGGCGLNNSQPCNLQIKLLGPDPAITSCSLGFEGNNTILNLTGSNFGSTKGTIKSGDTSLPDIREWKDGSIKVVWSNAPAGQVLPVSLTNLDGQIGEGTCGAIAQLALGAKVFCRAPSRFDTDNVDLTLADASKVLVKQKVKIDKDGIVQGLTQKLEEGKNYTLSLKAPKGIRQTVPFTAGGGITNIPGFILPIGDIFPIDGGDGSINTLDKAELNRQWNIASNVSGRSGDFNQDTRVNSIDWACMRYDFGKKDDLEAAPGVQLSPSPSPSPNVSPSPSASPGT